MVNGMEDGAGVLARAYLHEQGCYWRSGIEGRRYGSRLSRSG